MASKDGWAKVPLAQSRFLAEQARVATGIEPRVPYLFAVDRLERLRGVFVKVLKGQERACKHDARQGDFSPEKTARRHAISALIQDRLDQVLVQSVEPDLYCLVQTIVAELKLKKSVLLRMGSAFKTQDVDIDMNDVYLELKALEQDGVNLGFSVNKWKTELSSMIVIDVPRSDMRNPFSWLILSHECMHRVDVQTQLTGRTTSLLGRTDKRLSNRTKAAIGRKISEVIPDLMALQYIGPAYARMMVDVLSRTQMKPSEVHPSAHVRWRYLKKGLSWMKDNRPDNDVLDRYLPLEEEAYRQAMSSLETALDGIEESSYAGSQIDKHLDRLLPDHVPQVMNWIREALVKMNPGIPMLWEGCFNQCLAGHALMRNPSAENLKRCQDLLVGGFQLPIHPRALYNLALLGTDGPEEEYKLESGLLYSFRKWLVVSKTSSI